MEVRYLARLTGGPMDGVTVVHPGPWPLPDELAMPLDDSGTYHKTRESQLTEDVPNVARGAEYEWRPRHDLYTAPTPKVTQEV